MMHLELIRGFVPQGYSSLEAAIEAAKRETYSLDFGKCLSDSFGKAIVTAAYNEAALQLELRDGDCLRFEAVTPSLIAARCVSKEELLAPAQLDDSLHLQCGDHPWEWSRATVANRIAEEILVRHFVSAGQIYLYFRSGRVLSLMAVCCKSRDVPLLYWNFEE